MMDTSMARHQIQIEDIKVALQSNASDVRRIRNILLHEIDRELDKPSEEVNMSYVNACQDFLMRLDCNKANTVASHYRENLDAIHMRINKSSRPLRVNHYLRPVVALTLVIAILFGGLLFPGSQIITEQGDDEQLYYVQGVTNPLGSTSRADAEMAVLSDGKLVTNDWDELVSTLGFAPFAPSWLPLDWAVVTYRFEAIATFSRLNVTYQNASTGQYMIFDSIFFYDIENFYAAVEQNQAGTVTKLDNGLNIYLTNNFDNVVAVWQEGRIQYTLSAPIAVDDMIHCVESVYSSS